MIDANLDGRFAPKSKAMSANDILELPISCMAKTRALLNHCELEACTRAAAKIMKLTLRLLMENFDPLCDSRYYMEVAGALPPGASPFGVVFCCAMARRAAGYPVDWENILRQVIEAMEGDK